MRVAGVAGREFGQRAAGVAPFDRGLEAVALGIAAKPQALGRVAGDAVEQGREHLRLLEAHGLDGLVDDELLHHQLRGRHAGDAFGQRECRGVEFGRRHGQRGQPPVGGGAPVDQVAGQQQALGAHRADAVDPHRGGRAAPDARRHVADAGVVGHQQQVAAQRDVAAAGHRIAVDLGDGRLVAAPQAHELPGVALHQRVVAHRLPGHRLVGLVRVLGVELQVVAGAERAASALQHDRVHTRVVVGGGDGGLDLGGHAVVDRVEPLGAVERDRRDALAHGELQGLVAGHRACGGWGVDRGGAAGACRQPRKRVAAPILRPCRARGVSGRTRPARRRSRARPAAAAAPWARPCAAHRRRRRRSGRHGGGPRCRRRGQGCARR